MVELQGEVKYPGRYALTNKGDRLSDIIQRAGGLTQEAYANGIVFVRKRSVTGESTVTAPPSASTSTTSMPMASGTVASYAAPLPQQQDIGRIGIDLPSVLRDRNSPDNLILTDGDSIFIPAYSAVVTVRGAVNSPLAVAYVRGANLDYYIRAAGGGNARADLKRAYVTQPNGKVESRNRHVLVWHTTPDPQPGSSVFVPEKDPADRTDYVAISTAIASVVGSLVAIIAIVHK